MPVRTNIRLTGVRELMQAGKKMVKEDTIRIADGLQLSAQLVFDISQELVPKDTLALMQSAQIEKEGVGLFATASVTYGGESAPYAFIVHEDTFAFHEPPTQAKFLSHAVELAYSDIQGILRRQFSSTNRPISRGNI